MMEEIAALEYQTLDMLSDLEKPNSFLMHLW